MLTAALQLHERIGLRYVDLIEFESGRGIEGLSGAASSGL